MKKAAILLAVLCMALTATSCTAGSNQDYYESAQLYLGAGEYAYAADMFRQLGEYADSATYALYCDALDAIARNEDEIARATLTLITPFKSSEMYLTWLDARKAADEGEYADALALYEQLGAFRDSAEQAAELRKEIPEQAMEQGRKLMKQGEYAEAKAIFDSLNGYSSSAALAQSCLNAMMSRLDGELAQVSLSTAQRLTDAYAAIDDDAARERVAELKARFGVNMQLLSADHPYVLLEDTTLWRVDRVDGTVLTLTFEGMIAAEKTIATASDLPMTVDLTPSGLTIKLDLADHAFTEGDGTKEHPFR